MMPCRTTILVLAAQVAGSLKIDSHRHRLADFDAGVVEAKAHLDPLAEIDVLEQSVREDPQLPDKVKKPLMGQINVIRTEMCWARANLMEHEKCMKFLGLHCSKGSTGKGICKKFRAKVSRACREDTAKSEELHELHCEIAEDLGESAKDLGETHEARRGDDDGDGVPNDEDLFPDDPNESEDLDMDGVGDNSDDDIDGDGWKNGEDAFPRDPNEWNDMDGDGVGDNHDTDDDGDGVPNVDDHFPDDPTESWDMDGDGIGDNSDEDRDGDGHNNVDDPFPDDRTKFGGSESDEGGGLPGSESDEGAGALFPGEGLPGIPQDLEQPKGHDEAAAVPKPVVSKDGEVDSDGDGVKDTEDGMPNDPTETMDSDGDGIGDGIDAFPDDADEQMDSDGDGVGDNSDHFPDDPNQVHDADHDGIGDRSDAFPNNPREQADSDHDGVGDNADPAPLDPNCNTAPCGAAPAPAAAGAAAGDAGAAGAGAGASAGAPAPALAPAAAPGAPGALEPLIKPWELNKVKRALPAQGYNEHSADAADVEHFDKTTSTGDWGKEWPTKHETEQQSIGRICDLHPNSIWCKKYAHHGHFAR